MVKVVKTRVEIEGQVHEETVVVDRDEPEPWGPVFQMTPAFTDLQPEPSPLFGRADFFQVFTISFLEDGAAPSFKIEVR